MYVIKYNDGIYAGTYSDSNGIYCYSSNKSNKKKPKIFMTLKRTEKHLTKLKNSIPFGKDHTQYGFKILEWSEDELIKHLRYIGMNEADSFSMAISFRARKERVNVTSVDVVPKDKKVENEKEKLNEKKMQIELRVYFVNGYTEIFYEVPMAWKEWDNDKKHQWIDENRNEIRKYVINHLSYMNVCEKQESDLKYLIKQDLLEKIEEKYGDLNDNRGFYVGENDERLSVKSIVDLINDCEEIRD